jgi:regulator of replication initiation timing
LTIEDELQQLNNSIEAPKAKVKSKSIVDDLTRTLRAIQMVNPELTSSTKVLDLVLKELDMAFVVNTTNAKIEDLAATIADLLSENIKLQKANTALTERFISLEDSIKRRDDLDFKYKERASTALEAINQYLRSHP